MMRRAVAETLEGRVFLSISGAQPVNFYATVGAPYSAPVATFTDSDPSAFSTNYNVSIAYSNGVTSTGSISGYSGNWTVNDTQTFTQPASLSATITISDSADGSSASTTDSATVGLAPISLNASNVSATVGQDSTQNIATLTDSAGSYAGGNYSASLSVNGNSFPVTLTSEDSNGDYAVQADLSGLAAGSYSGTLNASESAGWQSVYAYANVSITVTEQPILVTGAAINATVGTYWSGTIATFDPQNPSANPANYSASINYGNGNIETGGISAVGNVFTVTGSQTFYTAGNLSPTITISDAAQSVTGGASVSVALSSISLTPAAPALTPYESFSGVLGSLTDSAGSDSISGNLSASVTLNYTTYPLTLASPGNSGNYSLAASSLPTLAPGTYPAQIFAQETSGLLTESTAANFDIVVSDTVISASGVSISPEAGVPWSGVIANFTHSDLGNASAFTTATTWGDASSPTSGTVNSGYSVTDTHTFNTPGTFHPTTFISDTYGTNATATSAATVGIAPLSLSTVSFPLLQGEPFSGTIATIADAAGQYANPGNYSATFSIQGVSYPITLTPDPSGNGLCAVNLTLPAFSPISTWGTLNITETIGGQSVGASATLAINVAANGAFQAPTGLTAVGVSIVNDVGQSTPGIDVSWTNDTGNVGQVALERSTDGGATFSPFATFIGSPAFYEDTSVLPGAMYVYRVSNTSADALPITSPKSTSAGAWTMPLTLNNLVASPAEGQSVQLSWSSGYMGSYSGGNNVIISATGASNNTQTYFLNSSASNYTVAGLTADTSYTFTVVSAVTVASTDPNNPQPVALTQSAASNAVTVQTAPITPTGLAYTMPSAGEIDLSWNATNPQDTISVQRVTEPSGITTTTVLTAAQAATHAFADTNIPAGSGTINYQVSATFNGVMSEQESSNFVSVSRTPAPIQVGIGNTVEEDLNLGGAAQPGDIVYVSVGDGFTITPLDPNNTTYGNGPFTGMTQITVDANGFANVLVTGAPGAAGGTLTVYNSSGQPLAIVPQEAVTISDPSVTLPINTTSTLDLTVTGSFLTIDAITFSCSLVTVSATSYQMIPGGGEIVHALVTAGSTSGIAPITATDSGGASTTGTAIVTVPAPVNPEIYVYGTTVAVGDTTEMSIYVINSYGGLPLEGEALSFSLGNGNISAQWVNATTNAQGYAFLNVTGVAAGNTPITVTDDSHYAEGYGSVSVTLPVTTAISVGNANLDVGATAQVTVHVTGVNGSVPSDDALNVSVTDGTIASAAWLNGNNIPDGSGNATLVITGITAGSTAITVTDNHHGNGQGQASVSNAQLSLSGENIDAVVNVPWSGIVGYLSDSNPNASAFGITVKVNYGDGTPDDVVTLAPTLQGCWVVNGTHTFPAAGFFTATVTANATGSHEVTCSDSAAAGGGWVHNLDFGAQNPADFHPVTDDLTGASYSASQWLDGTSNPIAFTRSGTTNDGGGDAYIQITATLNVNGFRGGDCYVFAYFNNSPIAGAVLATLSDNNTLATVTITSATELPHTIKLDTEEIHWEVSKSATATRDSAWAAAGITSNRAYIVNGTSLSGPQLIETVLDVGCSNASGQSSDSGAIVSGIWNGSFASRTINEVDGRTMYYYGAYGITHEDPANSVAALIDHADGRCGQWADFFVDVLGAQGVTASVIDVELIPTTVYTGIYALTGVSQGGTTSIQAFDNHALVEIGGFAAGSPAPASGTIYDPAYGGSAFGSLNAWATASIMLIDAARHPAPLDVSQLTFSVQATAPT